MTRILDRIKGPRDLAKLSTPQLEALAAEIRSELIDSVSKTGGHLGPNLGVVELTIAIHKVFESPKDTVVFDTGHQSYVHKLLTGRQDFSRLRSREGLSGYPCRAESPHDVVENSHASGSLSWADGIAKGHQLLGQRDRYTIAVIGDGALTGGMAWEALNNIAAGQDRRLIVIVNDNERSYAPTIGGLAHHLSTLRTTQGYERFLEWGKQTLRRRGTPGKLAYDALHGVKKGIKDVVAPQGMFEDLGLKYIGPVDGHDLVAMERALKAAKAFGGPVLVHAITQKGRGYAPARSDEADQFHAVGVIDPVTGKPVAAGASRSWTKVFGSELARLGAQRHDLVAITAAMLIPTGLDEFAKKFPERVFDVGIAEQHATASAAGLAFTGLHPVVAVYATFLNRAFDQVLLDVALHKAGVTFVLDRAGITGPDGPSHHGMWDLSLLQVVPGLRLAAPRDAVTLAEELSEAIDVDDAPTVLRFAKTAVPEDIPALRRVDGVDVLAGGEAADVLIVGVGSMVPLALEVSTTLAEAGLTSTVVDPRWVLPVNPAVLSMAADHRLVVVLEDGVEVGGVGARLALEALRQGITTPVHPVGVPAQFIDHATRGEVFSDLGLTAGGVAERVRGWMRQRDQLVVSARELTTGRLASEPTNQN